MSSKKRAVTSNYKASEESILNASGSRNEAKKIYHLVNHLEEQSDNILESIALATMIKSEAAAKQSERILFIQDTTSISYGYHNIEGMGYYWVATMLPFCEAEHAIL